MAAFFRCENDVKLAACAGFGTVVAGRLVTSALKGSYERLVGDMSDETMKDLAREAFSENVQVHARLNANHDIGWPREAAQKQILPQFQRYIDDLLNKSTLSDSDRASLERYQKSVEAIKATLARGEGDVPAPHIVMTDKHAYLIKPGARFEDLPLEIQLKYRNEARPGIEFLRAALRQGRTLDQRMVDDLTRFLWRDFLENHFGRHLYGETNFEGFLAKIKRDEAVLSRTSESRAVTTFESHLGVAFAEANHQAEMDLALELRSTAKSLVSRVGDKIGEKAGSSILKRAVLQLGPQISRLGAKAPLLLAGLGVAVALDMAFSVSPTACDANVTMAKYALLDPDNKCQPVLKYSSKFENLANSPDDEIVRALSDHSTCDYFTKFYSQALAQPKFVSLECHNQYFKLKTRSASGEVIDHRVIYYPDTNDIRQIYLEQSTVKTMGTLLINRDGSINPSTPRAWEIATPLRLYIEDARTCCASKDDQERSRCLQTYNGNSEQQPSRGERVSN